LRFKTPDSASCLILRSCTYPECRLTYGMLRGQPLSSSFVKGNSWDLCRPDHLDFPRKTDPESLSELHSEPIQASARSPKIPVHRGCALGRSSSDAEYLGEMAQSETIRRSCEGLVSFHITWFGPRPAQADLIMLSTRGANRLWPGLVHRQCSAT
jgi:hypothetical protein